jgi:hypothetical protein
VHAPAQREDEFINEVMTNHMFQDPNEGKLFLFFYMVLLS